MAEKGASAKRTSSRPSAYPEGVPCWVDAQLSDVEAGKRFYGELFGWTFEEGGGTGPGAYAWARLDGEPVAALVRKTDGRMPTVWTVYFAATDAEALAGRVRAAGGQIVTPPQPVSELGTTALVTDPQGAVFALVQPPGAPRTPGHAGFTGFGRRHEPGTFARVELYTRDTEAAGAFYGDLFHDALLGPDAAPDFGRAPVSDVFPAEMPPHFLVHFLVEDCEAALGTVARLGGRVRVPPFETSYGRVAVVSDGQGASFALLQR
ncbi:VOC family protein [Streptomyces lancefieldiae]|uniref:VOC family protein n=1 Tax=Streptomyces lancefieldiae TaxID=3075520 RepID=A0ABU3AW77_9ACTN|nr:VOC family protein [Streptomyces sp. DSM 40712]MDT0614279.1 VOC family protein [Streptomyces sp. DSM 40712]